VYTPALKSCFYSPSPSPSPSPLPPFFSMFGMFRNKSFRIEFAARADSRARRAGGADRPDGEGGGSVFSHKCKTFYFFIALDRSRLSCGYFITAVYAPRRGGNPLVAPRLDSSWHSVEVFYRGNFPPPSGRSEKRAFLRGHDIARSFRTEIILPAAHR
jgi:hypothetical protein